MYAVHIGDTPPVYVGSVPVVDCGRVRGHRQYAELLELAAEVGAAIAGQWLDAGVGRGGVSAIRGLSPRRREACGGWTVGI